MKHKIAYVNIHEGTRMNIDAMCEHNGWEVIHLRPLHDYEMSDELADIVWEKYYKSVLTDPSIDTIITGDTTITCGYPILKHMDELPENTRIILQVTNFFHWGNTHKPYIIHQTRNYMNHPKVTVVYIDPFIIRTMWECNVIPRFAKYIPLSGRVIEKQNKCIHCPCLLTGKPINLPLYYPMGPPKVPQSDFVLIGHEDLAKKIESYGISIDFFQSRQYGGPFGLKNYNAVVIVPYHYSTVAFQELMSIGLMIFVPTVKKYLGQVDVNPLFRTINPLLMDAYHGPLASMVQQFENEEDLVQKMKKYMGMPIEYKQMRKEKQIQYMKHYDENIYDQWKYLLEKDGI